MSSGSYVLEIEAWNGMDAVMRITNMARRAKLAFNEMRVVFNGERLIHVELRVEGEEFEARWLAAKLDRMPEVYSVTMRREEDILEEKLVA